MIGELRPAHEPAGDTTNERKHHPERVFTNLAHLIDEDFLREAYRRTSKSSAAGLDGVTAKWYAEHLDENLHDLYDRLRSGRYQAAPVVRVWIEKEDGGVTGCVKMWIHRQLKNADTT